ncbi:MAG: 4Fe-4S binding protein [Anaerococcus obesiensis]
MKIHVYHVDKPMVMSVKTVNKETQLMNDEDACIDCGSCAAVCRVEATTSRIRYIHKIRLSFAESFILLKIFKNYKINNYKKLTILHFLLIYFLM